MTLSKIFLAALGGVLGICALPFGVTSGVAGAVAPNWGAAVNGLQLEIAIDRTRETHPTTPNFVVEMRNCGSSDLTLNLGFALGNGKSQYPAAITLNLGDANGKVRRLELTGPAGVGGRLDALVLPLPAGAIFSISVELDRYWAPATQDFNFDLKSGSYTIEAQFAGKPVDSQQSAGDLKGFALMNFWQGTVTSNRMRFEVPSH